jgi:hypothetical protein
VALTSLFIQAVNEMINVNERRVALTTTPETVPLHRSAVALRRWASATDMAFRTGRAMEHP